MPDIAALFVFPLFLVFVRISSALLVFPAISDPSVNVRARLLVSVFIALIMWPLVTDTLPTLPSTTAAMLFLLGVEIVVGIMLGLGARLMMTALNVAGEMIAFATGLQAATIFDPINNNNSTSITLFLTVTGGVLIFAMNLHHLLIEAIAASYTVLPSGQLPNVTDSMMAVVQTIQNLFVLGLKMSAPIVVVGFLGYVAFGIFNRLIPQLHVFFVILPLQIGVGMFLLAITVSTIMALFATHMQDKFLLFAQ